MADYLSISRKKGERFVIVVPKGTTFDEDTVVGVDLIKSSDDGGTFGVEVDRKEIGVHRLEVYEAILRECSKASFRRDIHG